MDQNRAPPLFQIPDSDEDLLEQCRVETFTAGGKGGQHQNRTESGVRLTHLPTGLIATARRSRSQFRNKAAALEILRRRLKASNERRKPRVRTRVPNRERERRLDNKKRKSRKKGLRKRPSPEE